MDEVVDRERSAGNGRAGRDLAQDTRRGCRDRGTNAGAAERDPLARDASLPGGQGNCDRASNSPADDGYEIHRLRGAHAPPPDATATSMSRFFAAISSFAST